MTKWCLALLFLALVSWSLARMKDEDHCGTLRADGSYNNEGCK